MQSNNMEAETDELDLLELCCSYDGRFSILSRTALSTAGAPTLAKRMPRTTTGVADGSLDAEELGLLDGAEDDIANGNLDGSLEG